MKKFTHKKIKKMTKKAKFKKYWCCGCDLNWKIDETDKYFKETTAVYCPKCHRKMREVKE